MRGLRGIGFLSFAAAAMAAAVVPAPAVMPQVERRATVRKPVRQRRAKVYPDMNRAKRHPPAQSYREAADISLALGCRSKPLR